MNSQKDLSNILAANSRQMTLSKSIKDLRLYVSNSYSPSQIVKPPPPATQPVVLNGGGSSSSSSTSSTSSSHYHQSAPTPAPAAVVASQTVTTKKQPPQPVAVVSSNRASVTSRLTTPSSIAPDEHPHNHRSSVPTAHKSAYSHIPPPPPPQANSIHNPYVNAMMRPFKDVRSDQVSNLSLYYAIFLTHRIVEIILVLIINLTLYYYSFEIKILNNPKCFFILLS